MSVSTNSKSEMPTDILKKRRFTADSLAERGGQFLNLPGMIYIALASRLFACPAQMLATTRRLVADQVSPEFGSGSV
jgi:hypothetical protein